MANNSAQKLKKNIFPFQCFFENGYNLVSQTMISWKKLLTVQTLDKIGNESSLIVWVPGRIDDEVKQTISAV